MPGGRPPAVAPRGPAATVEMPAATAEPAVPGGRPPAVAPRGPAATVEMPAATAVADCDANWCCARQYVSCRIPPATTPPDAIADCDANWCCARQYVSCRIPPATTPPDAIADCDVRPRAPRRSPIPGRRRAGGAYSGGSVRAVRPRAPRRSPIPGRRRAGGAYSGGSVRAVRPRALPLLALAGPPRALAGRRGMALCSRGRRPTCRCWPWLAHHGRWPVGEEWLYAVVGGGLPAAAGPRDDLPHARPGLLALDEGTGVNKKVSARNPGTTCPTPVRDCLPWTRVLG